MALKGLSRLCVPDNYDLEDAKGDDKLLRTYSRNFSNRKSRPFGSSNGARDRSQHRINSIIKHPNQNTISERKRKRRICESESEEDWDDRKEKHRQLVVPKSDDQETPAVDMDNQRRSKRQCVSSIKYWEENFTLEDFQYDEEEDVFSFITKSESEDSATTKANTTTLKGTKIKCDGSLIKASKSRATSSDTETPKAKRILKGAKRQHHGSAGHTSSNLWSSSSSSQSSSDGFSFELVQRPAAKNIKLDQKKLIKCHQCCREDRRVVVPCNKCEEKVYCIQCIKQWYPTISEEEVAEACPYCQRNCNCNLCLHSSSILKVYLWCFQTLQM